ncbi:hypothetical protein BKA64DRAFT_649664 [Cadophora sp. MPI-SDFR-AT-0126]|nr:hypothetical protein BKA64DRAFT_649664 [Leotiomycetes sp. MPI-SDFR-AT-0126]
MWKSKFGLVPNEFTVLLSSLNLDQEPFSLTPVPQRKSQSKHYPNLFQDIIQNLVYGDELSPRDLQPEDKVPDEQMSKMQHQRRAVAYCAYETVRAWRDCFQSSLEYAAVFWAQYRYFMIIAFPTLENFHKCPAWRHPIAEQFNHDHPSVVDLILWPKLREKLVSTWRQYELPSLCVYIVQNLEFKGIQTDIASVVKLELDSSDILLEESFERDVHDIRNFIVSSAPFTARYPELAATIAVELILYPALADSQQEQSRKESLEIFDYQTLISGFTSQEVVFQPSPIKSSELQSGPIPSLNPVNSTDPGDPVADSLTDIPGSLDWWMESFTEQGFETFSRETADRWDPKSAAPEVFALPCHD